LKNHKEESPKIDITRRSFLFLTPRFNSRTS
jgi:hypothetical protein